MIPLCSVGVAGGACGLAKTEAYTSSILVHCSKQNRSLTSWENIAV